MNHYTATQRTHLVKLIVGIIAVVPDDSSCIGKLLAYKRKAPLGIKYHGQGRSLTIFSRGGGEQFSVKLSRSVRVPLHLFQKFQNPENLGCPPPLPLLPAGYAA